MNMWPFIFNKGTTDNTVKLLTNTDKQALLQQREHHEWRILRDVLKPNDLIQSTNQTFRQKDTRDAAHLYLTINQQQVACR